MDDQKSADTDSRPHALHPGDTISPATDPSPTTSPTAPAPPVSHPASSVPQQSPTASLSTTSSAPPVAASATDYANATFSDQAESDGAISWTASEFIAHDKSMGWYGLLAVAAVTVAAIIYVLTQDKISTAVVIVAAISLGAYGARKPKQQQYQLTEQGVAVGQKFYSFNEFRSFAILDEGAFSSISFMPLARFGQLVTIYFDPQDEEAIVDLLATRLPLEDRGHDIVDRFMKRIRF